MKYVIDKSVFEKQYNEMRLIDMARLYDISPQMISWYVRKLNIPRKGRSKKIIVKG